MSPSIHFPLSYQESREHFRRQLDRVKKHWLSAKLGRVVISEAEDLTIDWISAGAGAAKERLLIITTGLHGVEGFVGAAMCDLFVQEYLDRLDPATTGIWMIHTINPWGMHHRRRVNPNNVDLNRNFMVSPADFKEDFNPAYRAFNPALNPDHQLRPLWLEAPGFIARLLINLARAGIKGLRGAVLLGQQSNPAGLYYSGREHQAEAQVVMDLIRQGFSTYQALLLIDIHTGYGPRYQMSLVNSPAEKRKSAELQKAFRYPRVLGADPDQFYSMKGDMIDWIYQHQISACPDVRFYGTAFEFGVNGDSILNEIKSLRTMVYENQAYWKGALFGKTASRVQADLLEMYFPAEHRWREKALEDCRQAYSGVMEAEGFLRPRA